MAGLPQEAGRQDCANGAVACLVFAVFTVMMADWAAVAAMTWSRRNPEAPRRVSISRGAGVTFRLDPITEPGRESRARRAGNATKARRVRAVGAHSFGLMRHRKGYDKVEDRRRQLRGDEDDKGSLSFTVLEP